MTISKERIYYLSEPRDWRTPLQNLYSCPGWTSELAVLVSAVLLL